MLPNFIAKFVVERRQCIGREGRLAIDEFSTLRQGLVDQTSRDVAALFAEPVTTTKGDLIDVAYYGEPGGEALPIGRLDEAARGFVVEKLKARLALLAPLLSSSLGPLLAEALYVASPDDILAVGSEPLLVRWGVLPPDVNIDDRAARDAHFAATLGRYAPFGAPAIGPPRRTAHARAAPTTPVPATVPVAVAPEARNWTRTNRGLLIATAVAALATLLLSLPGVLATPASGSSDDADILPSLRQISQAMQDKLDQARQALAAVVCDPDGTIKPKDGEQGALPPAAIPVTPTQTQGDLALVARRASESVVLLMNCIARTDWAAAHQDGKEEPLACPVPGAQAGDGDLVLDSSGSGFFIAPKLVVTNTHVVQGAKQMLASSSVIGKVVRGTVLAATVKTVNTDADFAVVTLDLDTSPAPIPLATSVARLQNVVAAGFPGIFMTGEQIEQLIKGDVTAMPELTTFPGFVTLTKDRAGAVPLIFSSAAIAHGNSGGPLLDLCARAVGVNTLGGNGGEGEASYQVNIAEGSSALAAFLDQHGIAHQVATDACGPAPQASGTPPTSPAPTPAPPTASPPKPVPPVESQPSKPPPSPAPLPEGSR